MQVLLFSVHCFTSPSSLYLTSGVQKTSNLTSPRVYVSCQVGGRGRRSCLEKWHWREYLGSLSAPHTGFHFSGCFQPQTSVSPSLYLVSTFSVVFVACLLMASLSPGIQPFIFSTLLNWLLLFYLCSIFQNSLFNLSCVFSVSSVQTFILAI